MKIVETIKKKTLVFSIIGGTLLLCLVLTSVLLFTDFFKNNSVSVSQSNGSHEDTAVPPVDPQKVKIIPLVSDKAGIDPNTGFKLLCDEEYPESSIAAALNITPKQNYKLKALSSKEYELKFDEGLKPNSIYQFQMHDKTSDKKHSWAFQTKQKFMVQRTLPRHKASYVPIDTGIEITFSHEGVQDLKDYFEISPSVEGRFETHKKTVVFVPKKLAYSTLYTVKIKKGLSLKGTDDKLLEDVVFQFYTVEESTQNATESISFTNQLYNLTTKAPFTFELSASTSFNGANASIDVYQYQNESSFIQSVKKNDTMPQWVPTKDNNIHIDTNELVKTMTFETKIVKNSENDWGPYYFYFPKSLPEGHYAIRLTSGKHQCHTLLQVNNTTAYIMASKDKTLVWLNDAATGKPFAGATANLEGSDASAQTDSNGMAVINGKLPDSKESVHYYYTISQTGKPVFLALVDTSSYNYYYNGDSTGIRGDYWTYLYLDKGMYTPNDILKLWGLIKPRNAKDIPQKASYELCTYNYNYNYQYSSDYEPYVLESKTVELSPMGTFKGEVQIPNLNPGSYFIRVKINNSTVNERYFEVKEYSKPAYKIDIQPDKKVLFGWDVLNVKLLASFFEGTPVSNLDLEYHYYTDYYDYDSNKGKLVCDKNGAANTIIKPTVHSDSWRPSYLTINASNAKTEDGEINASSGALVFPRDMMIEVDGKINGNSGQVKVKTHKIDIAGLNQDSPYLVEDQYRGESIDTALEAGIYEQYWETTENGEYYDYINKKVVKKYDYRLVSNLVKKFNFSTQNGSYQFDFPVEKNKYYHTEITGFDSRKNRVVETTYCYDQRSIPSFDGTSRSFYLREDSGKLAFKTGEKVSVSAIKKTGTLHPSEQLRYLFVTLKNGIYDSKVTDTPNYSFDFSKEHIPNVFVKALCFDGTQLYDVGMNEFTYDFKEQELSIRIKSDKSSYKPGETVNMDIDVQDPSGKPCSAEVNLSVVDEAFFAIQDQYVDTLGSLYTPVMTSGIISDYISTDNFDPYDGMGGAEGGEGGDFQSRFLFKDNAFFESVTTDSNGKAKVSFKLPDNLTSWRVTYQGITQDLKAGNGKTNIVTKLPFFTDVIHNKIFLKGDKPSIDVRSYGSQVETGDKVQYNITLEREDGIKKNYPAAGTVGAAVNIPLGEVDEGRYTITVEASCGSYKDALKKPFAVVKNILEANRSKQYILSENLKIEGGNSLTTLTFCNEEASTFYNELTSLVWSFGDRVDQKLSRKIAGELLKKYFDIDYNKDEDFELSKYQQSDGGISLLSYDSSSAELSAKLASISGTDFDPNALKMYFYNILGNKDSTSEDVCASYWGLAALGEPVLVDINNLLESPGTTLKDKLYLGIALAELGDLDNAIKIYSDTLKDFGKEESPYMYIHQGSDRDTYIELTSLCSIIGMKTNAPQYLNLFNYVKINSSDEILTNFEKLIFIQNCIPNTKMSSTFTYELDGSKKEILLDKSQKYQLVLTKDKLDKIKFSGITGKVSVFSSFTGPVKDLIHGTKSLVKLERTYSKDSQSTNTFGASDIIKVTITPQFSEAAPDGYYELTDILPSGLKYYPGRWTNEDNFYFVENSGQKVVHGMRYDKKLKGKPALVYFAKTFTPGTYIADNAFIKHSESNVAGFTDTDLITIIQTNNK